MAYKFDGTTQTGVSGTPKLLDAAFDSQGEAIAVGGSGDDKQVYEAGMPEEEATLTILGSADVAVGDEFALTITWTDTGTSSFTNAVVTGVNTSGSQGDKITSTVTIRPAASAG